MGTTKSTKERFRTSLNNMKRKFRVGTISLKTGSKNLTRTKAEELKSEIDMRYSAYISSLGDDNEDHTYYIGIIDREDTGCDVVVTGTDVIYDEFGTGIVGKQHPHPMKDNYSELQPYNSGPRIRHFEGNESKDYWIFYNNGKFTYTQGQEPGTFIYDSVRAIEARTWLKEIIKKKDLKEFYDIMEGK